MKRPLDDVVKEDLPCLQDGDQGDSDDDVGMIQPYDAKKEPRPTSKLYDPRLQTLQKDLQKCVALLEEPLQNTTFSSGSTTGLLEDLQRRVQDNPAEKVKIGVVGDMKSGKFSMPAVTDPKLNTIQARAR